MLAMPLLLVASRVIVNVSPWLMLLPASLGVRPGCVSLGGAETAVTVGAGGADAGAGGCSTATAGQFVASNGYKGPALGRVTRPDGPLIQVVEPFVKAVQLSHLRQTSRPPPVSWSPSPLVALWYSSDVQFPTKFGIMSCSSLKPRMNVQLGLICCASVSAGGVAVAGTSTRSASARSELKRLNTLSPPMRLLSGRSPVPPPDNVRAGRP